MKITDCAGCHKDIEVDDDYEPKYCCSGLRNDCACMGMPINPAFCDECAEKLFGLRRE